MSSLIVKVSRKGLLYSSSFGFRQLLVNNKRNFNRGFLVLLAPNRSKDAMDPKKLTNEEWAKRLEPESYFCSREGGTEEPFSGKYYNHKEEGVYSCVCCDSDLFTSKHKYDSGSGWPSFFSEIKSENDESDGIYIRKDVSHGMVRNEVLCKACNSHLGHIFEDGPKPSGLRYCINSASLKFTPKKQ